MANVTNATGVDRESSSGSGGSSAGRKRGGKLSKNMRAVRRLRREAKKAAASTSRPMVPGALIEKMNAKKTKLAARKSKKTK